MTDRLKEGGLGGGFENLLSGVKNLLPVRKELVVSKIVADIMSPPQNEPSKADDYLYFDPKLSKQNARSPRQHKVTFQEAIVFVVGGGSYVEYQNLQEIAIVSVKTIEKKNWKPDHMCLLNLCIYLPFSKIIKKGRSPTARRTSYRRTSF